MKSAVAELIDVLHGSDREGSEIAYALKAVDPIGRDWGDRNPPAWHPASDQHPNRGARDAYEEFGDKFRHHEGTQGAFAGHIVDPVRHLDEALKMRADPEIVHPSNRRLIASAVNSYANPMAPDARAHDFYLANPGWYHSMAGHSEPRSDDTAAGTRWLDGHLNRMAGDLGHPLHPDHPDHEHFIAAHRQGLLAWNGPTSIHTPYPDYGGR